MLSLRPTAHRVGGWPYAQFEANRKDYEGNYLRMLELVPEFAERLPAATRETRLAAVGDLRGFFRKPFGPGWALVGDAGPTTTRWQRGSRHATRSRYPAYGFTCDFAKIEPPPAQMLQLLGAVSANPTAIVARITGEAHTAAPT